MRSSRPPPPFLLLLLLLLLGLLLACRCCRASTGSAPPRPLQSCKAHKVQASDRCDYIAKDNGITVKEFQGWNPRMECSNLQIGQILCVSGPGGSSPPAPESCKTYTVKAGDRCYYIAQDNGITVDDLRAWNPSLECSNLQIGPILCVSEPVPPSESCRTYTVKAGEGCWDIAWLNGITVDELAEWNPDMDCNDLQIGQILCVSAPPPPESCRTYTVKAGEGCWDIAWLNGITVDELAEWNPGMDCTNLQIGQILCISAPRGSPPPPPPPPRPPPPESCKTYTVKAGDNCWDIAWSNGITVDELEWWNPGMKCFNLKIGEVLCVSDPSGDWPLPQFCKLHFVEAGDSCWGIARSNGITVQELERWNPGMNCHNLKIGDALCVSDPRGGSPPSEPCKIYTVKAGDKCRSIARDNGITVKELKWWNPGLDCSDLEIGDDLCVSEPYYYNGNIKAQRLAAREGKYEALHSLA